MDYRRQTPQALDAEHRASLALYGKLEQALVARDREGLARLAGPLARHLESEVSHHFDFEERELFPRLAEAGEGDIAELLNEEHAAIREVAASLLPLVEAGPATLDAAQSGDFRRLALELVERQVAHIQKESMALLPMLDDLLDDETDRALSFACTSA
ncbi:MAG: hemerythrin domain-containing protein [Burkholderiales bacterium]|jgi:hemerythrin-like domain-containing protein|nr:hemerythrin domain-containing protein [Burkholderiales bacterium]